jgi:hypothetical protein
MGRTPENRRQHVADHQIFNVPLTRDGLNFRAPQEATRVVGIAITITCHCSRCPQDGCRRGNSSDGQDVASSYCQEIAFASLRLFTEPLFIVLIHDVSPNHSRSRVNLDHVPISMNF